MSAVVCGKRSLFDDLHNSSPTSKRIRRGGGSPIRFQTAVPPSRIGASGASDAGSGGLTQVRALFQDMDGQLVERVYESCGKNLEATIKSLDELRLSSNDQIPPSEISGQSVSSPNSVSMNGATSGETFTQSGNTQVLSELEEMNCPMDPADWIQWVDLMVKQMLSAASIEDARVRASRALAAFEKTISQRSEEVMGKEVTSLREQLQGLSRDNHILKRAVTIQHERQLEHENCARELQSVKQLNAQQQEQLRNLEMSNYALNLHLRRAQEGSSIPGHFHPNLF